MAPLNFQIQQNNGFGPISKKRGRKSMIIAFFIMLAFSVIGCIYLKNSEIDWKKRYSFSIMAVACSISGAVLGEFIRRICLFCEEYGHIETRHNNDKMKALKTCLLPGNWALVCSLVTIGLGISIFIWSITGTSLNQQNAEILLINMVFVPLFSYLTGLRNSTKAEISALNEDDSKNVADGLAWSYYFGYLKLILPQLEETISLTDKEVDGVALHECIQDYKVFIVIPKNCYCYTSFAEIDPRIKFIDCTHPLEINRAGVQRRIYKNSVYRVTSKDGKIFYCLMEYATPLMSLYDMEKQANSGLKLAERDEQVVQFYRTLKDILENDPGCRGKYHIVLTSDAQCELADTMAREIMHARGSAGLEN